MSSWRRNERTWTFTSKRAHRKKIFWFFFFFILFDAVLVLRLTGVLDLSAVRSLNTVFISILIQAFPFMLIGVLVSSAMHYLIPDNFIVKIFPTKHGLGFVTALFAGLLLPVCECAIIPVMTRLVKKGVALPIAITFMLSAPIINPIVIVSTLYAFPDQPSVALMRVGLGLLIALLVGLTLFALGIDKEKSLLGASDDCEHGGHGASCSCCAQPAHSGLGIAQRLRLMLIHAGDEFFDVGKYIVIGAFISSLIQAVVPREAFLNLNSSSAVSLFVMMLMAFAFSTCSTSDAFIGRSYLSRMSLGSIMGFLVYGPMMDIKNMLMLLGNFKKSFVIRLIAMITIMNFVILILATKLLF